MALAVGSDGNARLAAHLSEEGENDGSKVERLVRVVNRPWKRYYGWVFSWAGEGERSLRLSDWVTIGGGLGASIETASGRALGSAP
jgi:hypothetical protein